MANITVHLAGEKMETTLNAGERLLKGLWKLGLAQRGVGECGGNCACATCHVLVSQGLEAFNPASPQEEEMLDTLPECAPHSRLACQLVVHIDHDEIEVHMPC